MTESKRKTKQHKVIQKDYLGLIAPQTVYGYSSLGNPDSESGQEKKKPKQAKVRQKDYLGLMAPQTVYGYSQMGSQQKQRRINPRDNLQESDKAKPLKAEQMKVKQGDLLAVFDLTTTPPTSRAAAKLEQKNHKHRPGKDRDRTMASSSVIARDRTSQTEAYESQNGMDRFHSPAEIAALLKQASLSEKLRKKGDGPKRTKLVEENAVDVGHYLSHKFSSLKAKGPEVVDADANHKVKQSLLRRDRRKYYLLENQPVSEKLKSKYSPLENDAADPPKDEDLQGSETNISDQEKEIFISLARQNTKEKNDYIQSRKVDLFKELMEVDHDEEPLELEEKDFGSLNGSDYLIDIKRVHDPVDRKPNNEFVPSTTKFEFDEEDEDDYEIML